MTCYVMDVVVFDFETNGFPEEKGERLACLYYL